MSVDANKEIEVKNITSAKVYVTTGTYPEIDNLESEHYRSVQKVEWKNNDGDCKQVYSGHDNYKDKSIYALNMADLKEENKNKSISLDVKLLEKDSSDRYKSLTVKFMADVAGKEGDYSEYFKKECEITFQEKKLLKFGGNKQLLRLNLNKHDIKNIMTKLGAEICLSYVKASVEDVSTSGYIYPLIQELVVFVPGLFSSAIQVKNYKGEIEEVWPEFSRVGLMEFDLLHCDNNGHAFKIPEENLLVPLDNFIAHPTLFGMDIEFEAVNCEVDNEFNNAYEKIFDHIEIYFDKERDHKIKFLFFDDEEDEKDNKASGVGFDFRMPLNRDVEITNSVYEKYPFLTSIEERLVKHVTYFMGGIHLEAMENFMMKCILKMKSFQWQFTV